MPGKATVPLARVRGRLGRGGARVRPQPGLDLPAGRPRRGPRRAGRGRAAARSTAASTRSSCPYPAAGGHARRRPTASAAPDAGRAGRRHRAGGRAACARAGHARRRPGRRLRGLRGVQRAAGGRRVSGLTLLDGGGVDRRPARTATSDIAALLRATAARRAAPDAAGVSSRGRRRGRAPRAYRRCAATRSSHEQGLFAGTDRDDRDDDPRTRRAGRPRPPTARCSAASGSARPTRADPTSAGGPAAGWSSAPARAAPGVGAGAGPGGVRPRRGGGRAALRRHRAGPQRAAVRPARLASRAAGDRRRRRRTCRCAGRSGGSPRWPRPPRRRSAGCSAGLRPGGAGLRRRRRRAGARHRPGRRLRRDPAVDGRARPGVGRLVRACWSTSTTWPRWAPRRSACSTRSAPATPRFAAPGAAPGCARPRAAWGVPVLGGHTQLGVPAALVGHRAGPHRPPGARRAAGGPGDAVRLTADLGGGWRPGLPRPAVGLDHAPHHRRAAGADRRRSPRAPRPRPPRTCRMAGLVGTLGHARRGQRLRRRARRRRRAPPGGRRPSGDWLTCFPGFAMLTADDARPRRRRPPARRPTAVCGELVARQRRRRCAGRTASLTDAVARRRSPGWAPRHEPPDDRASRRSPRRSAATSSDCFARIDGAARPTPARAGVGCSCCPRPRLGGYLADLGDDGVDEPPRRLPPALDLDGPEIAPAGRAGRRHGRRAPGSASPTAPCATTPRSCVTGDGVLGVHRKVHQPLGEDAQLRRRRRVPRLRHAGRPAGHADLLRQGLPRGGPHPGPRRRRDHRLPVGVAGRAHRPRARTSPTTAGRAASTCSTGPARWRTRSCGWRPTSPGTFGSLRFVVQRQGRRPRRRRAGHHRRRARHGGRRRRRARGARRRPPGDGAPARPPSRDLRSADRCMSRPRWGAPRVPVPAAHVPVAVVGGGQAGLSMSLVPAPARDRRTSCSSATTVAHEWCDARWDSFCLVTPNWQCRLPGLGPTAATTRTASWSATRSSPTLARLRRLVRPAGARAHAR